MNEVAFNARLAGVLETKHPGWRGHIRAESRGVVRSGLQPDLVLHPPGAAPVVLETEFAPAAGVEDDARRRLGEELATTGDRIEQAIAVRIPQVLRRVETGVAELDREIEHASFRYCTFSSHASDVSPVRWPSEGWLEGGIDDLAVCLETVSLSEQRVAQGVDTLERGIAEASGALRRTAGSHAAETMAEELYQEDSEQTSRMAMAIVANALVFHTALVEPHGIETIDELRTSRGEVSKPRLLACWKRILREINYYPIFKIASRLLWPIPNGTANAVLDRLAVTASDLASLGATTLHDLSGRMFQRLIADRKFLATFYTLPESASLLAELAVARLEDRDWSEPDTLTSLRIADLACGTGALLSASYRALAQRHRRTGGDDEGLHRAMIEKALVAADIMPAATHLTASMLSSAHPAITFRRTQVHTMAYGRQEHQGREEVISLGSLDLIEESAAPSLFGTGIGVAHGAGATVETPTSDLVLIRGTADLVIMNPPFTRPTNHERRLPVPVPSFAGFGNAAEEQRAMSTRLKGIYTRLRSKGAPAGHGNAGLASNFIDLAHAKIKPGGVLALVLPSAFVNGSSWGPARALLQREYEDLAVLTIAAHGSTDRAFSADTGMAEALVVATKRRGPRRRENALFVNLRHRPRSLAEAFEMAQAVRRLPPQHQGQLRVGTHEIVGTYIRAPLNQGGCAALRETTLAETAIDLTRTGTLRLPRGFSARLPTTALEVLGRPGLYHIDINGYHTDRSPRGPFDIIPVQGVRPQYPALWSHDAGRERRLVVEPDTEGVARPDCEDRAAAAWRRTASQLHFTLDFQLNSQALAACVTPGKAIGGRAWPNFLPAQAEWTWPLVLWANTTLGMLAFWWIGTRQQQGRAILTITQLPRLTVLDPRALSQDQLDRAKVLFERFSGETFLPANEAYRDPVRQGLDRAVLVELLELSGEVLEPLAVLRDQWCGEPSVHGGKKTRIRKPEH